MARTHFEECVVLGVLLVAGAAVASAQAQTAEQIVEATGVTGGFVVHLGCGDGALTADLGRLPRVVVHALDTDAGKVTQARDRLYAAGIYGKAAVDRYDGKRLPYVDEVVNLLVASDAANVAGAEILRVLAPDGVAYVRAGETWTRTVKPRPKEIDEWSHFLHDASGNAVANDSRIGPPKRLRWQAGPKWCRSHEWPSSVNAVVTAGGRIFMIFDEAPSGVYEGLPQKCRLIARDAASGVLLWKVPMRNWQPKFGTGTGDRWKIHHTIPRRLVAAGDRVYVTLAFRDAPVSVLDAATGRILTEALPGTTNADEMILSDGVLIVKVTKDLTGAEARFGAEPRNDALVAVDVATGRVLWRKEKIRVAPYALSAATGRVVYHNMEELVCLETRTGKDVWRTPNPIGSAVAASNTLVIADGVVLFHGYGQADAAGKTAAKQPAKQPARKAAGGRGLYVTSLSLSDGKVLWQHRGAKGWAGACTQPTDMFVADGTVWCGTLAGRDIRTGEIIRPLSVDNLISPGHHYRCHRGKATENYLILPKRGAEFVDIHGDNHMRNDWLRAPCFTGPTPANGLLYIPPSQCFCYPGAKVSGFLAMSAAPADKLQASDDSALERGPAYEGNPRSALRNPPSDWPMYRRDGRRSGATPMPVPTGLSPSWEAKFTCRTTPPVVVGDRLWVAEKDAHRIRCLDAATGKDVWSFCAGGRIDSAPSVIADRVLFGCRDGWVYCLRAADGVLAWRFRAAPTDRRTISYEQVESIWPVHGAVLVVDGRAYFAAGRSSFLDGGMIVYALDIRTGKVVASHLLVGPWPDIKTDVGRPFAMEGALPDLLVSDGGDHLFMGRIKFDLDLNRLPVTRESPLGELDMGEDHLVPTWGFLDDTGFDRVYWMHSKRWPGFYFSQQAPKSGQLVVFDDSATYAVKYFYRRIKYTPALYPGGQGYLLFADDIDNEPTLDERGQKSKMLQWLPEGAATDRHRRGGRGVDKGTGYIRENPTRWQKLIPLRIRAMVLAGDKLFAAGVPDVVDPKDPLATFEGRTAGELRVFSTQDGAQVTSCRLPTAVAFDGMIAARQALYLVTQDGRVMCMAAKP